MAKNKIAKWSRLLTLVAILAFVTYEAYLHQVLGGGKAPSVHALCPYGALESLYNIFFLGGFIQKIYSGTVVLLLVTLVIALVFRRSFCGLLCPFGALQELFARIGLKIFKRRLIIPAVIDQPLRYLKYLILALTIGMAWFYGSLWMAPYDPYSAYSHLSNAAADLAEEPLAIFGYLILLLTVIGSLLYDRFFCKYLCPMGAFYGIIGKYSLTKVERNESLCISCKQCNKACPVNIDVAQAKQITTMECINCNECVLSCPVKDALTVKTAKNTISPLVMLVVVVGFFFGTILLAQATGNFELLPEKLKEGQTISITEVKGYYTIQETAKAVGLELKDTYQLLGIPEQVPASTKMKEISKLVSGYEFDVAKEKAGEQEKQKTENVSPKATNEK